jgi:hypothetical protein
VARVTNAQPGRGNMHSAEGAVGAHKLRTGTTQ